MIFDFVTNDNFKKLLDGKIAAGDSNKLGGKGASEYNLGELAISEKALDKLGTDYSIPTNWSYIGMITPTEKFSDAGWLMGGGRFTVMGIFYDGYKNGVQTIFGGAGIKQRECNAGTWGEWKLIGSDLANYLSKTGGVISGAIGILDGYGYLTGNSEHIGVSTYGTIGDSKNWRKLGIYNSSATGVANAGFLRDVTSGVVTEYNLLHTGNKPTGAYTGTGASRIISTNGLGRVCVLYAGDKIALVTMHGAVVFTISAKSTEYYSSGDMQFLDGSLKVPSNAMNVTGATYYYQVV